MYTEEINDLAMSISNLREDNKNLNEDDFFDVLQNYLLAKLAHLDMGYRNYN
jgi:hypothetical protein